MTRRRLALPLVLVVLAAFMLSKPVTIGARSDEPSQVVGLRFTDLEIPRSAQILGAYVEFAAHEPVTRTSSLTIRAQAVDDAPAIASTDGATPVLRPLTTAGVSWSPSARGSTLMEEEAERTPDLAAMLQEIVSRPGWTPGNAVVLVFTRTGDGAPFDGGQDEAPQLRVDFRP